MVGRFHLMHITNSTEKSADSGMDGKQRKQSAHVATAVHRGHVIASRTNGPGFHAEIALLRCHEIQQYRGKHIDIFVTRLSKNGHALSRPCASCSFRLARGWPNATVYYTNARGQWTRDDALDNAYICRAQRPV